MISLRQTLRSLLKTPTVTAIAIFSLALGIGANTAIFSVFEQLILRPLPVAEPDRLVNISDPGPRMGSVSAGDSGSGASVFSYLMFRDLEAADTAFSGVAAHCGFGANLAYEGNNLSSEGSMVSGSYFEVLGLQPALGRLLSVRDDQTPGDHTVVVLSHSYWQNRFASSPDVLGKTLIINGLPMEIIGVTPKGFSGTTLGSNPQIFVPLSMREKMIPGWEGLDDRQTYWAYLFARLAPGTTIEQAAIAANVPYRSIIQDVEVPLQEGMSERNLARFKEKALVLEAGQHGQSTLLQEVRIPLLLLLGVTGFVLLIACANIANLLLIRATGRAGEIAVRMSIGARRHHIVSQLLAESFVLAIAGSLAGFLVAKGVLRFFASIIPPEAGPRFDFGLGPSVWLFVGILTVLTGLVGLFPALHSTRKDLTASLKSQAGQTSASRSSRRFHVAMATAQIALSMALLIAAGLFTRSLVNVSRIDLGIEIEQIATFGVAPELNGYTPEQSKQFFERLENEIAALPGVNGVTASMVPLIAGSDWRTNVSVQGFESGPDIDSNASYNLIGPGYFSTLGTPLHAGREFEARDTAGTPRVVIVNEAFAEKFGLGKDAVGKRMERGGADELGMEIIGLVENAKHSNVKDAVPPVFYMPYRQDEQLGAINFYVRAAASPEQLLTSLRGTVSRLDPNLPIENLLTMESQLKENLILDRILSTLSAAFAIVATLLAAIGLYGVLAYSVAQRRREIGLRMALGADAGRVRGLVMGQVGRMTLVGAVVGLLAAIGLGKVAGSLLYGLDGHDPIVLVSSALILCLVALGAGFLPAQRAAHVDPIRALRDEG